MFQETEIRALYLAEAQRHTVAPIARWWPDYRSEYSNFRVVQRVVMQTGPLQLTFRWPQEIADAE